jgi:beta-lactamase superfamily II metal-dependent hydrolase
VLCVGPASADLTGDQNQHSLNFLVIFGEVRFLFTGDWVDYTVRRRHEAELNRVDVLSFPHHGFSPMCIKPETMRLLSPRVILIPGGGTSEDRVKQFALKECSLKRYPRFYSNRDGNILLTCDGVNLWSAYQVEPGTFPRGKIVP